MSKHNPFDFVHSEFGFLESSIMIFIGAIWKTYKPDFPLTSLGEILIALNALFWFKQYKKADQEIQKMKVTFNTGPESTGTRGDPLS